ncbi:MAG: hypothetical protein E7667_04800 [Ruminococcaceae bacterium]|nr:hypothetical protein [Oscillospiraceae bacterium]
MKKVIIITSIVIALIIAGCVTATILIRNKDQKEEYTVQGTYSNVDPELGTGSMYEFDKDTITATYMSAGNAVYCVKGTYEIEDGYITFTFSPEDAEKANVFTGKHKFEYGEDYIKVDGLMYPKKES